MTPVDRVIPMLILYVCIGMSVLNEPENPPKVLVINHSIPKWTFFFVFIVDNICIRISSYICHMIVTVMKRIRFDQVLFHGFFGIIEIRSGSALRTMPQVRTVQQCRQFLCRVH